MTWKWNWRNENNNPEKYSIFSSEEKRENQRNQWRNRQLKKWRNINGGNRAKMKEAWRKPENQRRGVAIMKIVMKWAEKRRRKIKRRKYGESSSKWKRINWNGENNRNINSMSKYNVKIWRRSQLSESLCSEAAEKKNQRSAESYQAVIRRQCIDEKLKAKWKRKRLARKWKLQKQAENEEEKKIWRRK